MVVVGSGVAGLSCAIAAAEAEAEVTLVTADRFDVRTDTPATGDTRPIAAATMPLAGGNTALAQGGIAAALDRADNPGKHAADTRAAGAGLVDAETATLLAEQGVVEVRALIAAGFAVDRHASGQPELGLEGAHSHPRIVHAGEDRTGAALHAFLAARLRALVAAGRVLLRQGVTVLGLCSAAEVVTGVVLREQAVASPAEMLRADAVVLATGGYAAMYPNSTNHAAAIGQGVVLAARLGAVIADLEFVQFHPTVLATASGRARGGGLISEAVRGAGAVLLDGAGHRFMCDAHEAAELAPRDVVARTMDRVMRARGESHLWLDATVIVRRHGAGVLQRRFPALTAMTAQRGFDWTREPVPVAPAAHYSMGGVVTDLDGRSSLPGLFAVGEVANTGVHGANRLASNSLLEGLVFGRRAAHAAHDYVASSNGNQRWQLRGAAARNLFAQAVPVPPRVVCEQQQGAAEQLRTVAAAGLGIDRDAEGIARAARCASAQRGMLAELTQLIACAAQARTESRGAHWRSDYPKADQAQQRRRSWAPQPLSMPDDALGTGSTVTVDSAARHGDERSARC